jgi:hypothetical protein
MFKIAAGDSQLSSLAAIGWEDRSCLVSLL